MRPSQAAAKALKHFIQAAKRLRSRELCTARDDIFLLFRGQLGIHRQSQDAVAGGLADREVARAVAQVGQAFLQMQRPRIVDFTADTQRFQVPQQGIATAVGHFHHVLIERVPHIRSHDGRGQEAIEPGRGQQFVVAPGRGLPAANPAFDVRQFHAQNGGVYGVQAGIPAKLSMVILWFHAVDAQAGDALGPVGIVGRDHAAVAEGAQRLGRVVAEAGQRPECTALLAAILRPERLSRVLDHVQTVPAGDPVDGVHVRTLAEQVNRHDRSRARRDFRFDLLRINVECVGVDVGEDRRGPEPADGAGGGEKGERRHDDFVARPDLQGVQRQQQGIGAGRAADGVRGPAIGGHLALQGRDLRAQDHLARRKDARAALRRWRIAAPDRTLEYRTGALQWSDPDSWRPTPFSRG